MRFRRLVLAFVGVAAVTSSLSRAQSPATGDEPVSADRLMATVRALSSPEFEGRASGTGGGERARAWIAARLAEIGVEGVEGGLERSFAARGSGRATGGRDGRPVRGTNLVGLCQGAVARLPFFVVSAHYDHHGLRDGVLHPGADDNASGVAVLLEVAHRCVARPFRHGLILAFFDAEEGGLHGARAFVEAPPVPRDRLALNVNLDMVARGDTGELYASGTSHSPFLKPLLDPVAARAPVRLRFGHDTARSGTDDWTQQSDHAAFHAAGIPFVYFGVEDHPDYHKPTDTADRIDPRFFAAAAATILDALRALDAGLDR
jgi:hypothetical protein